jgi:outer membrane protein OmpA-like peptidoglycan-associated protein
MRSLLLPAALFLGAFAVSSTAHAAWTDQSVVHSIGSGRPVVDFRGNCVRTHFLTTSDECGIRQAAVARPLAVIVPRTEIAQDARAVYFDFNSAALRPEAQAKLDSLSTTLRNARDVEHAEIVGYADRIGTAAYNERLSQRRAVAVQNYMTQRGYLNTKVAQVRYLGESQSKTPCPAHATREQMIACLTPDRKVELQVVYQPQAQYQSAAPAPSYYQPPAIPSTPLYPTR